MSCVRAAALVVALGVGHTLAAQGAPAAGEQAWAAQVDALFATWDKPDSPGCALGVIQDGKLVHARGFGQASLELSVPIAPETVFDIGSTSKQFAAACIGLLVQDKKLGVDDDVRAWIPELSDFGVKVTLDHMLHHTSGLPDYIGLLETAGFQEADVSTAKDALDALAKVTQLDFQPGEKFEYSNTNFFLLSYVVERASGKSLAEFARERIFAPLGMTSTLYLDDYSLVVPHRATGYGKRKSGGFRVYMSDFEQTGDGGVQTCVRDMLKWDTNFYSHQVGGDALQTFLHTTGKLNDGKAIDYARGLFVDTFRGLARVRHGGSWAGYRAELMRFPAQKTSFVCLCNLGGMNPTDLCEKAAAIVLAAQMTSTTSAR